MGDCFSGGGNNPMEIIPGTPKDVAGLRAALMAALQGGMQQGATPYTGPLGVGTDPMRLMAANMLSQKMGYGGYKPPGTYNMMGSPVGSSNTSWKIKPGSIKDGGYKYDESSDTWGKTDKISDLFKRVKK